MRPNAAATAALLRAIEEAIVEFQSSELCIWGETKKKSVKAVVFLLG